MPNQIQDLRKQYKRDTLNIEDCLSNPMQQFKQWFDTALASDELEPNAMCLSTATKDGVPSSRIVLIKGLTDEGIVFYTNYDSTKGNQITDNPTVAINFHWKSLERQVKIIGIANRISREASAEYFHSRPIESQLSAYVSPQSQVITSRAELETLKDKCRQQFKDQDQIPLKDNWGGYLIKPNVVEFWQGRPDRLHDRIRYSFSENSGWVLDRLAP